jgi:hypothetical protein
MIKIFRLKYLGIISIMTCFFIIGKNNEVYGQIIQKEAAFNYLDSRGEVFFRFTATHNNINSISTAISVDKVVGDTIYAYANKKEFENFLRLNIPFNVLLPPSLSQVPIKMASTITEMRAWDSYPTYSAYLNLMNSFVTNFPDLCSIHEIGTSVNDRKLLFLKISDNTNTKEAEPEFMFSSSIHGDELTGCILTLRLADYLLNNYNTDPFVKRLVDSVEIWINPLANPDGTYAGGNNSVNGATRYNANYVDLNRNFADPAEGQHPDGEVWQPETEAMMDFFQAHNFVFSANYHGGAEVMNYPWDNFLRRHPDDAWFQYVSLNYADTAKHYGGSGYFSDIETNGITNGADWYMISGGRQDFMTYFCHGREITIEVSEIKLPQAADLPSFWEYNYRSMLHYIENCLYGIQGVVTDSATHEPLRAKLEVMDHDADSSQVYSDSMNGNYYRMLEPGSYDLKFTAAGYKDKLIEDLLVTNYKSQVKLDIELAKKEDEPIALDNSHIYRDLQYQITEDMILQIDLPQGDKIDIAVVESTGRILYHITREMSPGYSEIQLPKEYFSNGFYFCRIGFKDNLQTIKISRY